MADKDRGTVYIEIGGVQLKSVASPIRYPLATPKARLKTYFMRDGSDGDALRVIERLGAHISYSDVSFKIGYIESSGLNTLTQKFRNQDLVDLKYYEDGDLIAHYRGVFQESGLVPGVLAGCTYKSGKFDAEIKLHILEQVA